MNSQTTLASLACWTLGVLPAAAQQISKTEPAVRPQVMESYGKLPLSFEANQGQTDRRVKFLSHGSGYTLFLTEDSAVLSLHGKKANAALRMKLVGANAHAAVTGAAELPGKSNYFAGNDPKQWRTNVPTYGSVKYTGVYPGIDLVYHGNQQLLEYDFVVAPGADPRGIDLRFQGATKLSVNRQGGLVVGISDSEVIGRAPVVHQEINGQYQAVAGRYVLRGKGRVGFSVPDYDRNRPLVIDPTVVYTTYLGGRNSDRANAIALDARGNLYLTGTTSSLDFPATASAFQTTLRGSGSAFVTKLNASGSALLYSTYLGGDGGEGNGIAVDADGNAYVTGAASTDFPTTPGASQTGGVFVTKLNPTGTALIYSELLSGMDRALSKAIALDPLRNAYITGASTNIAGYCSICRDSSCESWCRSGFNLTDPIPSQMMGCGWGSQGSQSPFVVKLNAGGGLVYADCLDGSHNYDDSGTGIGVDASGNAYVTGWTASSNFPTTPGAPVTTCSETLCAFLTKLNTTGSALVYSTYLGPTSGQPGNIAVDAAGNAYLGFSKVNASGSVVYGGGWDGVSVAIDAFGNAYYTGQGHDHGCEPYDPANYFPYIGLGGWYVSRLDTNGRCAASGDLDLSSTGRAIAVDNSGNAYVTGTAGPGFATTSGVVQTSFGGGDSDAFIVRMNFDTPVTLASLRHGGSPSIDGCPVNPGCFQRWFQGPLTLTLAATDPYSAIAATYFRVGLDHVDTPDHVDTYEKYAGPFTISADGGHIILFYSVNTAGYAERPRELDIAIDSTAPVSRISALPATAASPNFRVQWLGTDATSGVLDYTIFASDNGGPFNPWLGQTTATQAWYVGTIGHTYRFYSSARDVAGNVEVKATADATTFVLQMSGDANGDGKINCTDLAIVKASMGKSAGQTGFDPRADVNHDGVVNVLDLAIVSQKLIPGTTCP